MRIIAGAHRGRRLTAPRGTATRPTSDRLREDIFNILMHNWPGLLDGARVADIFAGSGAMGIEALSRGAKYAAFVEKHGAGRDLVTKNLTNLGIADSADVLAGDARRLPPSDAPFDLIFMDPPYRRGLAEAALVALQDAGWLHDNTLVILETGAGEAPEIPAGYTVQDSRTRGASQVFVMLAGNI